MTKARELIEAVAAGKSARSLIVEETVPSWKAGEPVPRGYTVVFGHLVHDSKFGGHHPDEVHIASTDAWSASGHTKTPSEHAKAASLHHEAAGMHADEASYGDRNADAHRAAAKAHEDQAKAHEGHA